MPGLTLSPLNEGIYRVLDRQGQHLGNLKRINGQWKFKAIGYGSGGELLPGGGPLTDRHNTVFATLDEAALNDQLALPLQP